MAVELEAADRGAGPPVVLLHGQPGDRRDWVAVVDRLVERVRVIVPDRPGYGRTGGAAVGIGANSDALVALLDRLAVADVVVAGYSWSGAVALDLALRYPERLRGIVLVSSIGGEGSVDRLDQVLGWSVVGPLLSLVGIKVLRLGSWRSFVVEQRAMLAELPSLTQRLGEIRTPAAVVIGDVDRVVRPASQLMLAGALLSARLVRVPGGGHVLPLDAPDVVADEIAAMADGDGGEGAGPG